MDGSQGPVWAHSGRELFYRNWANELVAVQVSEGLTFESGIQEVLFSMEGYLGSDGHPQYDVSPDDERFLMLRLEEGVGMELMLGTLERTVRASSVRRVIVMPFQRIQGHLPALCLQPPVHEHVLRHDPVVERVSLQNDEIGVLTHVDATDAVSHV